MTPILTTRGLKKAFGAGESRVEALRGIALMVEKGEFLAIMGPSGCGKSTLLHLLAGLERPDSGEVFLGNLRVDGLNEAAWAVLRRKRVGFVFQSFNLIGNLTVAGNVEMPALLAGASAGEAKARARALLDQLGLAGRGNAMPSQLSGGQQQRVAIARALVNRPDVLFADEPTGNLDSQAADEVRSLLRQRHAEGQTIVVVTHDPRMAAAAQRVLRMRDGLIQSETRVEGRRDPQAVLGALLTHDV
jgi:putative ABC transport system ATP-binding protein